MAWGVFMNIHQGSSSFIPYLPKRNIRKSLLFVYILCASWLSLFIWRLSHLRLSWIDHMLGCAICHLVHSDLTVCCRNKVFWIINPDHISCLFYLKQTLFVEPTLCLCDCPGLVMPSFVTSKAEMVVNGILPVDQLRDFISPVSLISFY